MTCEPLEGRWIETRHGAMYVRIAGPASDLPTLILEAGGGASGDWWAWVQQYLASSTRVLSYDRAGLGRSTGLPDDVGALAVAERLQDLLAAASIPGPYLIVGHSLGGLYARGFAAAYPDEVCGLVMVDPTASRASDYAGLSAAGIFLLSLLLRMSSGLARLGLLRRWNPFFHLVETLPPDARARSRAMISDPRHLTASAREVATIRRIQAELSAHSLAGRMPLLIVSAGKRRRGGDDHGPPAHHWDLRQATGHARLIVFPDADHGSLLTNATQAALLADEILSFAGQCDQHRRSADA